jgi:hypothetical protein
MGFRESRLRGKIDGIKRVLSRLGTEDEGTEQVRKIREQLAETEAELKQITDPD